MSEIKSDKQADCLKSRLLEEIHARLDAQIETAQTAIDSAIESKNNETKSSAGDKFETGRAMMQIEQEKNEMQLSKTVRLKKLLYQIDVDKTFESVSFGSLVFTKDHNYFISIGIGKVEIDDKKYYAISYDSPIGKLLMGKAIGDQMEFRGNKMSIQSIE
jgi:transcription elongation GreA/GreB family factor